MAKRLIFILVVSMLGMVLSGCNKNKVEKETLWGVYQEPVTPKELPADSGAKELNVLWSVDIGGGSSDGYAILKPAFYQGSVYVANRSGDVYRRDAETGDVIWKKQVEDDINAATGVGEGLVVVAHDNGYVTALRTEDGSLAWQAPVLRNVSAIPAVGKGRVIIRTSDGLVIGLDTNTGETAWQIQKEVPGLTVHGDSVPAITGDAVLVGLSNGKLIANNVISGRDYWEADLSFVRGKNEIERLNDSDTPPIVQGTTVYSATYQGSVVAAQIQDASTIWRADYSTRLPMAASKQMLVITEQLGNVVALNTLDGSVLWKQDSFTGYGVSRPIILDNRVIIGDAGGNLYTLDIASGGLIEIKKTAKGAVLDLATNGEHFTVFTSEGELITLSL